MNTRTLIEEIEFKPMDEEPKRSDSAEEFILFSACDGYRIAYPVFDFEGFIGFVDFMGEVRHEPENFIYWAKLPAPIKITQEMLENKGEIK